MLISQLIHNWSVVNQLTHYNFSSYIGLTLSMYLAHRYE